MQPEIITFSHVGKCNTLLSQRRRNIIIMLEDDDEAEHLCVKTVMNGGTKREKLNVAQVQSGDFLLGNDLRASDS